MIRSSRTGARNATAAVAGLLTVIAPAGLARADAAGPTDYETSVVAVSPPTESIEVGVVGGDSFLQLAVEPGVEVVVLGYQQEPYLRFRSDGAVEENQRSPAAYLNADRFGGAAVPAGADPTLPPDWQPVGSGGRYAWHDHRAHWMSPEPPADRRPGDQIQAATVPLLVDGAPVEVSVVTEWLPEPSRVPLVVGAVVGGALVLLALATRHRLAWPLLVVAAAAGGVGWWQYRSLPAETGPLAVWWLLPAIAVASVLLALVLGRRLVSYALVVLAALELGAWVYLRRDGVVRALIPTDAPFWLDRGVMAASAVIAVIAAVAAAIAMFRLPVGGE